MKIHTPILAGAILGILLLSACTAETDTTATTTTPNNQPGLTTTGTVTLQPGQTAQQEGQQPSQQQEVTQPAAVQSEADIAAYNSAVQLRDLSFCDKIKQEVFMKECRSTLTDNATMIDALAKLDETACEKMSTQDKKDACRIIVQAEVQKNKQQEDKDAGIKKDYDLMSEINMAGDLKRCAELTDANFVYACEMNIITNQAIEAKDPKICDSGSTDQVRQDCVTGYNRSLGEGPVGPPGV